MRFISSLIAWFWSLPNSERIQLVAAAAVTLAAVGSWFSANAARRSAKASLRALEAQILSGLLDAYRASDMAEALRELRAWANQQQGILADAYLQFQATALASHIRVLDDARRIVSQYFQKIHTLWGQGYISKATVRAAATQGQVEFYRSVIEPMEWAINRNYNSSSFEDLGRLYRIRRPPMEDNPDP